MRAMAFLCWLLFAMTAVHALALSTKPSDVTASNLLYAVPSGGTFFMASPPVSKVDDAHSWLKGATEIGIGNWQRGRFQFLFFGPDGDLYAVFASDGSLIKGSPPK